MKDKPIIQINYLLRTVQETTILHLQFAKAWKKNQKIMKLHCGLQLIWKQPTQPVKAS